MTTYKKRLRRGVMWFLICYVGSYLLLMTRTVPAYDGEENLVFQSSCRFTPHPYTMRSANGGMTTVVGRVTILNYFYYPLELLFFT